MQGTHTPRILNNTQQLKDIDLQTSKNQEDISSIQTQTIPDIKTDLSTLSDRVLKLEEATGGSTELEKIKQDVADLTQLVENNSGSIQQQKLNLEELQQHVDTLETTLDEAYLKTKENTIEIGKISIINKTQDEELVVLGKRVDKLENSELPSLPIDTDTYLTSNSDEKVPSQKAIKTYVDRTDSKLLVDISNLEKKVDELNPLETEAKNTITGSRITGVAESPGGLCEVLELKGYTEGKYGLNGHSGWRLQGIQNFKILTDGENKIQERDVYDAMYIISSNDENSNRYYETIGDQRYMGMEFTGDKIKDVLPLEFLKSVAVMYFYVEGQSEDITNPLTLTFKQEGVTVGSIVFDTTTNERKMIEIPKTSAYYTEVQVSGGKGKILFTRTMASVSETEEFVPIGEKEIVYNLYGAELHGNRKFKDKVLEDGTIIRRFKTYDIPEKGWTFVKKANDRVIIKVENFTIPEIEVLTEVGSYDNCLGDFFGRAVSGCSIELVEEEKDLFELQPYSGVGIVKEKPNDFYVFIPAHCFEDTQGNSDPENITQADVDYTVNKYLTGSVLKVPVAEYIDNSIKIPRLTPIKLKNNTYLKTYKGEMTVRFPITHLGRIRALEHEIVRQRDAIERQQEKLFTMYKLKPLQRVPNSPELNTVINRVNNLISIATTGNDLERQ